MTVEEARAADDAKGVHVVAHTLKSSSAAVGAMALSRQCAVVALMARESRLDEAGDGLQRMIVEALAARDAARRLAAQLETAVHNA